MGSMSAPVVSQGVLDQLSQFDTPTICNVIELFAVRPQTDGFMDGRIRACFPEMGPVCGFASTATFQAAEKPSGTRSYGTLDEQVARFGDLQGPAFVVIQDIDQPVKAATFGEVMAATYVSFGVVGLITSGGARDLDQVRAVGLSCFSDGVICSHGYPQLLDIHVPVEVGGLAVEPGDLLHGDQNGVTSIPIDIASEVADVCQEYCDAEAVVLDYCRAGNTTPEGFSVARKELGSRLRAIRSRVARA